MTSRAGGGARLSVHAFEPRAPLELGTSRGFALGRPGLLARLSFDGHVVFGEASPLPGYGAKTDDLDAARRALDALDPEKLVGAAASEQPLGAASDLAAPLASASARHALEQLVLGLSAALRRVPLEALLGKRCAGADGPIPTSAVLDLHHPEVATAFGAAVAQGIRTLKFKCGQDPAKELRALDHLRSRTAQLVPGDTLAIRLDPNAAFDLGEARRFLEAVLALGITSAGTDLRLEFVEDPTPHPAEWGPLARLVPLAVDESLGALARATDDELDRELTRIPADYVILKPMVLGGASVCLRLAESARRLGRQASLSHAFDGPVALRLAVALARRLQPDGLAAGLGLHAGLAGWSSSAAEPALGEEATVALALPLCMSADAIARHPEDDR